MPSDIVQSTNFIQ